MRTREAIRQATKDGRDAGVGAASWAYDGNTPLEWYRKMLKGIEDGDPMILDSVREPNLSGEYAGDPTPRSLAEDYGIGEGREDALDAVCEAWEIAARDCFWARLETVCRMMLQDKAESA